MKRNYFAPAAGAIGLLLLASGLIASASTPWKEVLSNGEDAHPSSVSRTLSPTEAFMKGRRVGNPGNTINPASEGLHQIPASLLQRKAHRAPTMRSPQAPRGSLYAVVNRHATMEYTSEAYVGSLNPVTGILTPMHYGAQYSPYAGFDYIYQANSYRNGDIICSRSYNDGDKTWAIWDTYDLATGEQTGMHRFSDPTANGYSITYNADLDIFFICGIDPYATEGANFFGIVDPKADWKFYLGGRLETSSGLSPFIAAICYNPVDQQLYAFDNRNFVYTIEWQDPGKSLQENIFHPEPIIIEVGDILMYNDGFLFESDDSDPYPGQICYSPMDEMFVAVYRDNAARTNRIVYIHPETFEGIVGKDIKAPQVPYIASIFCTDDFASSDAPTLANSPKINFHDADLSGNITFTVPSESFIGVDLTGTTLKAVAKIDGKVIDERNVKAGESYSISLTLEQGQHTLEYTTAIGENVSPVRKEIFYTGYDAPKAPANVSLVDNLLTWDVPDGIGAHNGYVDTNDITYNVYIGKELQNSTPLSTNSFTLTPPADMKYYTISVVATSRGQVSPEGSINQIFGEAFKLPFYEAPTESQAQNYTVINANNDDRKFYWGINNIESTTGIGGWVFQTGYFVTADDWLILPAIYFDDSERLYNFEFDAYGIVNGMTTSEGFEIFIGNKPNLDAMKTMIYSTPNYYANNLNPKHNKFNFAVPTPGSYYLAIHITTTREQGGQGLSFHNLEVKAADGQSAAVPGEPTNISVKADEFGEQVATATATLPTVDILGHPLPADQDITLTFAYTDASGHDYSNSTTGKPGQTVSVSQGADTDGFQVYYLTPSNENGSGYTKSFRLYVGMDIPLHPDNIAGVPTADNMGIEMTWTAPGNVGRYGGFVDTSAPDFHYNFYTKSGISLQKIGETRDTKYTFYPYGSAPKGALATYYLGPSAVNQAGESIESMFIREDLGSPYELPVKEEWNSSGFTMSPYTFFTSGGYAASYWEGLRSAFGMNIGDPVLIDGGVMGYSQGGVCPAKMILPKFSTAGNKKTILKLRYWDYNEAPRSISIYARRNGNVDEELIGTFQLKRPAKGQWVDGEINLPAEFNNNSWVQVLIATQFMGGVNEYLLLDNFEVMDDNDYDLKITKLDGMTQATMGDILNYDIVVANAGRERISGNLKVEVLDANNNILDSDRIEIPQLTSNQTFEHTSTFVIAYPDLKDVTIRASIEEEDDNINNNVRELKLNIMPSSIPIVSDLSAERLDDKSVKLTWTAPSTEYGNYENFEGYKPFQLTENFDYWQNINGDDLWPLTFENLATGQPVLWENSTEKSGWVVYNFDEMNCPNERIIPHSGKQALMARCGGYDETSTPIQSSKWFVSPLVEPNTEISFWYSTFVSDTSEYVEIWTCEKADGKLDPNDRNLSLGRAGDFRKIASKSKLGEEDWEYVTYMLSRREVRFALRYCSYDGYAAFIDDLAFTPQNMLSRTAESYSVYRCDLDGSNPVLIADKITATSFVDNDYNDRDCKYYVVAYNTVDDSLVAGPQSKYVTVLGSSVDGINAVQSVIAGKGSIEVINFAGERIVIASADGKIIVNANVNSAYASYPVEKGVYLATIGKRTFKVIVK